MVGSTWPQTENRPIANRAGISHHFHAYLGMFQECQRGRNFFKIAKNRCKPQKTSFLSRVHRSISDLDPDKKIAIVSKIAPRKKSPISRYKRKKKMSLTFFHSKPRNFTEHGSSNQRSEMTKK